MCWPIALTVASQILLKRIGNAILTLIFWIYSVAFILWLHITLKPFQYNRLIFFSLSLFVFISHTLFLTSIHLYSLRSNQIEFHSVEPRKLLSFGSIFIVSLDSLPSSRFVSFVVFFFFFLSISLIHNWCLRFASMRK